MFFANDLSLAVYFIFILEYGNDVRQKADLSIFLFEFKMGRKVAETTRKINKAVGPGTVKNVQCSGGSRSFAKETRGLKMRRTVTSYWKSTTTN